MIDVSYSVLAAGTDSLNQATNFSPKLGDGVSAHADVKDASFPVPRRPARIGGGLAAGLADGARAGRA